MSTIIASTYELIECIGSGGGGVVYIAKHLRLNKMVVLKADKRKLTTHPELLRREVDTLKNLNHTYIPQVYDFFMEGETVYTVIDFVEGESLDKPLKRGERFSQAQVIKWACQMLDALSYLHRPVHGTPPRGIVHSDIKPANIMLTPLGDIRLIDFNIALAIGEENVVGLSAGYASPEHYGLDFSSERYSPNNTDSRSKRGINPVDNLSNDANEDKIDYQNDATEIMSEETATEIEETVTMTMKQSEAQSAKVSSSKRIVVPDARSDIYSLGATLYHLLSGNRPAKKATDVIPLSDKEFSPLIVHIITKAMSPDPNLRYQTADEMLYDFTHLREKDPRTIKQKRMLAAASVTFAVMLASGVFASFTGLKRMESEQKMLTLAEYSQSALNDGDSELAIEYALEALPQNRNIFTAEYTTQAQKALSDALGLYDLADGYKQTNIVKLPSETLKIALSPDGKTGVAMCAFEATVFDTETWETLAVLPMVKSALADVVYIDADRIAYAGEKGLSVYSISEKSTLWTGKMTTGIAVSADKNTIAGIYKDEGFATLYDADGNEKKVVNFGENKQRVLERDTFGDPDDNLLALSSNGKYLAVSFANGGLVIYNTEAVDDDIIIYDNSEYTHFEGGFAGNRFVFSATNSEKSEFAAIDTVNIVQNYAFDLDSKISVLTKNEKVYIANKSTVVEIDPVTGEQREAAFADADVRAFSFDNDNTIVATDKNEYLIYDKNAELVNRFDAGQVKCSFVDVSNGCAVEAGIDTPNIRILKKLQFGDADVCTYDDSYEHSEARINADRTKLMLFNYKGFRIYDITNNLIADISIPDAEKIYDQQYSHKSGNLAVMYDDAFRLYSGSDGTLIYEKENLSSVSFAKYGISIFDGKEIKLIDIDSGKEIQSIATTGEFGAYCGIPVTDKELNGGKFIGSGKTSNGYVYAVAKGSVCNVYDEMGKQKFQIPILENSEVFFTENEIITAPLHGTPVAYSLQDGGKISDLETDAYITYITELDDCIITQYVTAQMDCYAIIVDKTSYQPLAYLPNLTDIVDNELFFDYQKGTIRKTKIYSLDEMMQIARNER